MSRKFIAICDTCGAEETFDMPVPGTLLAMDYELRVEGWSVNIPHLSVLDDMCPGCLEAEAVREDNPRE